MHQGYKFDYRLVDTIGANMRDYLALHNMLFKGAAITQDWVRWYHGKIGGLDKDSRGTRTYGLYDGDQLIGIWSVEPKIFVVNNGHHMKCGRCFAVGINPEYRRMGLFVELSKYAIEEEKKRSEYDFILGFPQSGRPVIGGHFKAGWEEAMNLSPYSINTESYTSSSDRRGAEVITDFAKYSSSDSLAGCFYESNEYRNLRWLLHPHHHYLCYGFADSYIVLKPYLNFCHIVDFKGSAKILAKLFTIAKDIAKRHGWVELNLWCADNEYFMNTVLEQGFTKGDQFVLPITMITVRIAANNSFQALESCHLQMGIEEAY